MPALSVGHGNSMNAMEDNQCDRTWRVVFPNFANHPQKQDKPSALC